MTTTTTTIEKLGRLGYTATPDESGRLLLADAERGEPVAIVSEAEAEALADSLLGPPADSHVSRAYRATPPAEGALVSVDGAGSRRVAAEARVAVICSALRIAVMARGLR